MKMLERPTRVAELPFGYVLVTACRDEWGRVPTPPPTHLMLLHYDFRDVVASVKLPKITYYERDPGGGWRGVWGVQVGGKTVLLRWGRRTLRITR